MLLKNIYNIGIIKGTAIIDLVKMLTIENAYTIEGDHLEGVTMYMYNTNGLIIMMQELITRDNTTKASTLLAGMYMMRCGNNTYKIIKQ